jgi:hypothetical protein
MPDRDPTHIIKTNSYIRTVTSLLRGLKTAKSKGISSAWRVAGNPDLVMRTAQFDAEGARAAATG